MNDFYAKKEEAPIRPKQEQEENLELKTSKLLNIKLSSLGVLNAPAEVSVRNYDLDDALELSMASQENILDSTIIVMNKIIQSGFDPMYLHQEELKEILLNIYANYWGNVLKDFSYPYTEEELEDENINSDIKKKILNEDFIPKVDIPISSIKTIPIQEDFKEPISITFEGETILFRLSRIGDLINAKNYVNKKYLRKDQEFSNIKKLVDSNKFDKLSYEDLKSYQDYIKEKIKETAKIVESLVLVKVNSKSLHTIEEKLKYSSKVKLGFWKQYNTIIKKYGNFGISPEVSVISPLTGKEVTRRFQFRLLDFISTDDIQDDTGYVISFGD